MAAASTRLLAPLCREDDDDGLPARPRSELERSSTQTALRASLDFHTAVHGHRATMDLVRFLLPEKEPEEPEKKSTAASAAAHQEPKQEQPKKLQVVAAVAPKGPLWSDLSSDEDDGQAAK